MDFVSVSDEVFWFDNIVASVYNKAALLSKCICSNVQTEIQTNTTER